MIDFELTEEQQMIRDTVGAFARDEIRPAARPADESGSIASELIEKISQLGLVRSAIPTEFGGDGDTRSAVTSAIVCEELGYGDMSIAAHSLAPRMFVFPILEMGTPEQKARYLKPYSAPSFIAVSAALTEPSFDFDSTAMRARARRDGSSIVLSGRKCFVPLADQSDRILVYAAADHAAGFSGVDAYVVERSASGLTIGAREKNMGLKPLATFEVELNDCRVGLDARVGGEKGINYSRLMSEMRVALVAMAVGMARGAFEYARDYAKERRAFGVPIATKQSVSFMLADMALEVDATRLLAWEAAWQLDRAQDALESSYLAKNYAADAVLRITDSAVQVLGGHGYIREHPVEMWLRNARGLAAFDALAIV
ncbi:MAG TPA: acyl-CoA dehydrogenase family protein [Candidatus Binataceae bacterium]|nr:acyl-CoA dehydrogenase family protein [Candidatus Binataceae bacterium]